MKLSLSLGSVCSMCSSFTHQIRYVTLHIIFSDCENERYRINCQYNCSHCNEVFYCHKVNRLCLNICKAHVYQIISSINCSGIFFKLYIKVKNKLTINKYSLRSSITVPIQPNPGFPLGVCQGFTTGLLEQTQDLLRINPQ